MTNDYDAGSKGTRLIVAKRNRTSGNSSLIDPYGAGACDFRDEIFPRERITFKRATVHGIRPVVGVRRAVSRGKAAIRLAFLTVSDGC